MLCEADFYFSKWFSCPSFLFFNCGVARPGTVSGTQACWCPGRILRKADRAGRACLGQQRSGPLGLPTVITWGWKHLRQARRRECVNGGGISGGRDILPAPRFLTVALSLPGPRFLPFSRPLCAAGPGQERLVPVGLTFFLCPWPYWQIPPVLFSLAFFFFVISSENVADWWK